MDKKFNYLFIFSILFFLIIVVSSCTTTNQEFKYTSSGVYFERPSFVEKGKYQLVLTTQTDGGVFHVMTDDEEEANKFVNAQIDLLSYLGKRDVELRNLDYYVSDYDDTFSDSANDAVYIGLTSTKTYKQVLVTLQTLWGEYTDYGYLYALSNEIAKELKWDTDSVQSIDELSMNNFFIENSEALNLLYPCFTIDYASQETIDNCKVLCLLFIGDFKLKQVLSKPIEEQIDSFRAKSDAYAQKLQVEFIRDECKYAYNGEYMPLKILTTYAEFLIDVNFEDSIDILKQEFDDYSGIFRAMSLINAEITVAVESLELSTEMEVFPLWCLSSDSSMILHERENINIYRTGNSIRITSLHAYAHEFFHHLYYLKKQDGFYGWQAEAFSEIGRADSHHWHLTWEDEIITEKWAELFLEYAGHEYQSGKADYYESCDIMCYVLGDYTLNHRTGGIQLNSITRYLVELYGEDTVINLYLYPDTVSEVTGKEWDSLIYEWKQYIKEKYEGCEIPEWILEGNK